MRRDEPVPGRGSARAGRARATRCELNIDDLADRAPRPLDNEDVIDTGAHRLRYLATPHVRLDAGVYGESTGTLLCGDLFTAVAQSRPWSTANWSAPPWLRRTCSRPPA